MTFWGWLMFLKSFQYPPYPWSSDPVSAGAWPRREIFVTILQRWHWAALTSWSSSRCYLTETRIISQRKWRRWKSREDLIQPTPAFFQDMRERGKTIVRVYTLWRSRMLYFRAREIKKLRTELNESKDESRLRTETEMSYITAEIIALKVGTVHIQNSKVKLLV